VKNLPFLFLVTAALLLGACRRPITSLQRKEAANLASEAQFALALHDWPRAAKLLAQAADLSPDTGDLWLNLGAALKRTGDLRGARTAYTTAVAAYTEQAERAPSDTRLVLQEIYTLGLLGRFDEARQVLERARARHPDNRDLRIFAETGEFERMRASPGFRELAL
jgi:Flp pilus assembly protein TadD